ncbi:MAG: glycosyltransferase [Chitinophagaceae bacterium]|jgi:glycosyltransferase involved in cell wall biosynthesis|nr:glycosyltransferase [Chitinophagaceae bacterium]
MKPIIVVSAHRCFLPYGVAAIIKECLLSLAQNYADKYQIKALVYKKELYPPLPQIEYIEFPLARKNVFYRFYYEYVYFKKLSKKWQPYLWLSLQDTTPNVQVNIRAVYFHNPLPAEKFSPNYFKKSVRFFLLHFLYRYIYLTGISKNNWIAVQQVSLTEILVKKFSIANDKILIFPPKIAPMLHNTSSPFKKDVKETFIFIYPAAAFPHKNFEVIINAVKFLNEKNVRNFEVIFTTSGEENRYARQLKKRNNNDNIHFKSYIPETEFNDLYQATDCLLFPSLAETWGLPLSEFIQMNKPIIAADLPYAHETTSGYGKIKFFNPQNAEQLAGYMLQAMEDSLVFDKNIVVPNDKYETVHSWQQLFDKIFSSNS